MSEETSISTVNKQWAGYVPLHCHSYFSLLDGFCSPEDMANTARKNRFRAIALTDHGTCAGLYRFYNACKEQKVHHGNKEEIKEKIKPILGTELYLVDDINIKNKDDKRLHVTLLAKNKVGYKNLIALSSVAYLKGFYSRPRIDVDLLKKHKDGIICGSACINGLAAHYILKNDMETARKNLLLFKEIYGDDFFVEIMVHKYNDEKTTSEFKIVMHKLYKLAKELHILPVATCDSHYADKEDYLAQDVLLSIATKDTIKNPKRFSFESSDFYIKPFEELEKVYKNLPELLSNSIIISDKIEDNLIEIEKDLLPDFKLPPGESSEQVYLKSLIDDGMVNRGLKGKPEYEERIAEEWDVIVSLKYAKYFLILWDVIAYSKREGIRTGPGRGSGVASLCLYCLGITHVDPVKYNLLFSRFLNKDRVSPPDVDLDFDYTKQEQVFQYLTHKYGVECTTRIGTYTSLKAKDAVRRVCKVLDIGNDFENMKGDFKGNWESGEKTLQLANEICKSIPNGPNIEIDKLTTYKKNRYISNLKEYVDKYKDVFSYAKKIEGKLSAAGVHPAGIIVCKDPVVQHVPLRLAKDVICTQYNLKEVEELGLLKFDFLALKTLTLVEQCLDLIKKRHNKDIDINSLEPNDQKVFDMLTNGDTGGVFQLESTGMTKLIGDLRIDTFNDIVVANALYRPGVLNADIHTDYCDYKHNRKQVEYIHPIMKELLSKTYGNMIFQEQIMLVSIKMAGFSASEADTLRKGIGKKEPEKIMKLKDKFIKGCINHGVEKDIAERVFSLCQYFGGYGFNECLLGSTKVFNKIDKKRYSLEELCNSNIKVVLDSYVDGNTIDDEVVKVFKTGKKEVYEIELSNGMIIKCTLNHKFICEDGKAHTVSEIIEKDMNILYEENIK
jgi:DNA polymerase-3 subunit alpha